MLVNRNSAGALTKLAPMTEKDRRLGNGFPASAGTYVLGSEQGTAGDRGAFIGTGEAGVWSKRFDNWRNSFEQSIGPKVREYWPLYRAFNTFPLSGPDQGWRDKTVLPEAFKLVESLVPRDILGQFGGREFFAVEARNGRSEEYEDLVRTVLTAALDQIGRDGTEGGFYRRMMDALRYRRIMGHVFLKVFWREESQWIKTKLPQPQPDGKVTWLPVEKLVEHYNGVDVQWLGLDSIAIDTSSRDRRWAIERVRTTMQALRDEDANYRRKTGMSLYKDLDLISPLNSLYQRDGLEEPQDTEGWPLDQDISTNDPVDEEIELWMCWDNRRRTLTKLVNGRIEIAFGYAPTPDGLDPYISIPNIPIPGRPYGESDLHYVKDLIGYQIKLARARADEVLLGIWQQYVFREGSVLQNKYFFTPGGALEIANTNPDRPVEHDISLLPRRPVMAEAYNEQMMRQTQAEAALGSDGISQGVEATNKSRKVSATEVQQRVTQGSTRRQLEALYLEESLKRPLLRKVFALLQQNLTVPMQVQTEAGPQNVDLSMIQEPIDIVIGGGIREMPLEEKLAQTQAALAYAANPAFLPYLKVRNILAEEFKARGRKKIEYFLKTEEEVQAEQQQAQMAQMAQQAGVDPSMLGGLMGGAEGQAPQLGPGGPPPGPMGEDGAEPPADDSGSPEELL